MGKRKKEKKKRKEKVKAQIGTNVWARIFIAGLLARSQKVLRPAK
jgi:hypothetical protein